MCAVTVAEILRHAEKFEETLAKFYHKVSCETTQEGVRLLTDYMSRHRTRIAAALDDMPEEQVRRLSSVLLRYEPKGADYRDSEQFELPPNATATQLLDAAVRFDESLISFFRQVEEQPVGHEAKELFQSLIQAEEGDEIELKKIRAMHYF